MSGTFQGTSPNPVAAGGNLIIRLYDPDRAGQTVFVAAYNPSTGLSTYIPMVLDEDGVGGVKWVVPVDWDAPLLTLQSDDTPDLTVTVTEP